MRNAALRWIVRAAAPWRLLPNEFQLDRAITAIEHFGQAP